MKVPQLRGAGVDVCPGVPELFVERGQHPLQVVPISWAASGSLAIATSRSRLVARMAVCRSCCVHSTGGGACGTTPENPPPLPPVYVGVPIGSGVCGLVTRLPYLACSRRRAAAQPLTTAERS